MNQVNSRSSAIKVYSRTNCPWCTKIKEWLSKKNYSYLDCNIAENETYCDELLDKTGQLAVPVLEIGDTCIIGFQEKELDELLKNKNN